MADAGRALRSAVKGANYGGSVGSFIPGVGTAIGTGVGTIGGLLYDWFGGNKHKENPGPVGSKNNPVPYPSRNNGTPGQTQQSSPFGGIFDRTPGQSIPNLTPQQQALQDLNLKLAQGIISGEGGLNPIAKQAQRRFQTETVPSLANRFSSLTNTPNLLSSPAFQGQALGAGAQLDQDLAAQQYGLYALLSNLGNQGENIYKKEQPSFAENTANAVAQYGPQWIQLFMDYLDQNKSRGSQEPWSASQELLPTGYKFGGNPLPQTVNPFTQQEYGAMSPQGAPRMSGSGNELQAIIEYLSKGY
jgi:hypothetical protein